MASRRHEVLAHVAQRLSQPPLRPSKCCHCVTPFTTKGARWKEKKNKRRGAVPPQNSKCRKRGGGSRLINVSLGPRELGGGRQWPSCRHGHFGADRWALGPGGEGRTPGKKPVEHTGPESMPSESAFEQGPPTFLLGTPSKPIPPGWMCGRKVARGRKWESDRRGE